MPIVVTMAAAVAALARLFLAVLLAKLPAAIGDLSMLHGRMWQRHNGQLAPKHTYCSLLDVSPPPAPSAPLKLHCLGVKGLVLLSL